MSTSVWGNQDGGRWVGAEFSHQEGALAQLEAEMCSGLSKGFQEGHAGIWDGGSLCARGGLSPVTGEEPHRSLHSGQVHKRQLVRVDLGVKGKPAGHSFRGAPGSRSHAAGS